MTENSRCWHCKHRGLIRYNVGDRYGKLTIQSFYLEGGNKKTRRMAHCTCDCGGEKDIFIALLKRNKTISCGCLPLGNFRGIGNLSGAYMSSLRTGARTRGLTFAVTKEQLWDLFLTQNQKCALTGLPLVLCIRNKTDGTASLDRRDSKLPYTIDNVQWVHKDINRMKQNISQPRFLLWCQRICTFQDTGKPGEPLDPLPLSRPRIKPVGRRDKKTRFKGKPLSILSILDDVDRFKLLHGRFPIAHDGKTVPDKPIENWTAYDSALRTGGRGLTGESSLFKLMQEYRKTPLVATCRGS